MAELLNFFEERYAEVDGYLVFLENIDATIRGGYVQLSGAADRVTPQQQKVLKSSLYLQLYNLVEATVHCCLRAIVDAVEKRECRARDLNDELRAEWVRSIAGTHRSLGAKKRHEAALQMCEQLLKQQPVKRFDIESGSGGNWDDREIEKICHRVGLDLKGQLDSATYGRVKSHWRDEKGALELVRNHRNGLAHGRLSFVECSEGVTISDLKELTLVVGEYLRAVIDCFERFILKEIKTVTGQAR